MIKKTLVIPRKEVCLLLSIVVSQEILLRLGSDDPVLLLLLQLTPDLLLLLLELLAQSVFKILLMTKKTSGFGKMS